MDAAFCIRQNLFPPEMDDRPAEIQEGLVIPVITLHICLNLADPVIRIAPLHELRLQDFPIFAVKELTVTEDRYLVLGQGDVRPARQSFIIFPISIAALPEFFPQGNFYRSVLPLDAAHVPAPFRSCLSVEPRFFLTVHYLCLNSRITGSLKKLEELFHEKSTAKGGMNIINPTSGPYY